MSLVLSDASKVGGGKPYSADQIEESYELVEYPHEQKHETKETLSAYKTRKRAEKIARLDAADEMKFSHSIQFNAVPDWSSHYIAYSNLKKLWVQQTLRKAC